MLLKQKLLVCVVVVVFVSCFGRGEGEGTVAGPVGVQNRTDFTPQYLVKYENML